MLFPLLAAVAAGVVTVLLSTNRGNQWCAGSAFSCSMDTNVLGIVLVGGATSYWFYGFRRALLLARHRRAVLARLGHADPPGDEAAVGFEARDVVVAAVLSRYRDWRSQPPVTVVAGPAGSGKTVFLAEVVRRLAGSHSWYVPVPLDDVAGGGEQDILDAAQQQLDVILHDASINPGLIESLSRSLTRSRRLMIVIDNVDRIGPSLSSYERALVVQRLMSSAQQLDVPLLATAQSGTVESIAGTVIELPPPSAEFITDRLDRAHAVPTAPKRLVLPALTGPLATPAMVNRVITLIRRDGDRLAAALRRSGEEVADLVVWRHLLEACEVPGAVLTAEGLELIAYVLLITGQREIKIGAGPEWQHALRLGADAGVVLPAHHAGFDEIAAYADGGFLDTDSSAVMLQFPSPDIQAILAGQFLVREPSLVAGIVPQLGTSASARQAVAAALRSGHAAGSEDVHTWLLSSLNGGAPLTAAAHAAGLSLAIRHPPPGWDAAEMDDLASRLALVLADRVTAANGPALGVIGLRDAVQALAAARRQIVILDCCHSGAFAGGAKGDTDLALQRRFQPRGHGRVVLTASRSTEYSFEGDHISGEGVRSVFTHAIVDGLRTGDADRDKDGLITVTDLYNHVSDRVGSVEPRQSPELWRYASEGDLLVAHSIRGAVIEPVPLPENLRVTLDSPRPPVRETGVAELSELLDKAGPGLAITARQALQKIADADIPRVAAIARAALGAPKGAAVEQVRREIAKRRRQEEEQTRREAVAKANRLRAEEQARLDAEEKANRLRAEEQARLDGEEKANRLRAEEQARRNARSQTARSALVRSEIQHGRGARAAADAGRLAVTSGRVSRRLVKGWRAPRPASAHRSPHGGRVCSGRSPYRLCSSEYPRVSARPASSHRGFRYHRPRTAAWGRTRPDRLLHRIGSSRWACRGADRRSPGEADSRTGRGPAAVCAHQSSGLSSRQRAQRNR